MMRTLLLMSALLLIACGARTELSLDPDGEDASVDSAFDTSRPDTSPPPDTTPPPDTMRPDTSRPDTGTPDTGAPDTSSDTGAPDAGTMCERDRDCMTGVCGRDPRVRERDLEPVTLACLETRGRTRVECRQRDECERGLCAAAGICVAPCRVDRDCEEGERCRDLYVRTGERAMQPVRACAQQFSVPDDVTVRTVERNVPAATTMRGEFMTLPNSRALTSFFAAEFDGISGVTSLRRRRGDRQVLYDGFDMRMPINPVGASGPDWAVLIPSGPDVPSGPYDVQVLAPRAIAGEVHVFERERRGATLNLNFYFVGARGFEADRPPARLRTALRNLETAFLPARIRVGEIRYVDIVGGLRDRLSVIEETEVFDDENELGELFALSAGAIEPAVNIFMIRIIDGALGTAAGIPGIYPMHGTFSSGLAISMDVFDSPALPDEYLLGNVLGHELGHTFGLAHTSETDGSVNDPFPDTPECTPDFDLNDDGLLSSDECERNGADHLMFWAGVGNRISAQQARVLRSAIILE